MRLSFAIESGIRTTTLKFNKQCQNVRTKELFFECKKITYSSLNIKNKPEITLREFVFHYVIYSCI